MSIYIPIHCFVHVGFMKAKYIVFMYLSANILLPIKAKSMFITGGEFVSGEGLL